MIHIAVLFPVAHSLLMPFAGAILDPLLFCCEFQWGFPTAVAVANALQEIFDAV